MSGPLKSPRPKEYFESKGFKGSSEIIEILARTIFKHSNP